MAFYWLSKLPFASPQTLQTLQNLQNPPNPPKPSKPSKHPSPTGTPGPRPLLNQAGHSNGFYWLSKLSFASISHHLLRFSQQSSNDFAIFIAFPMDFAIPSLRSRVAVAAVAVVAAVDPVARPSRRPQQGQHPAAPGRRAPWRRALPALPALLPRERQGSWTLRYIELIHDIYMIILNYLILFR